MEHEDIEPQQCVEADEAVSIHISRVIVHFGSSQIEVGRAPNSAEQQEEHKGAAYVEPRI